MKTYLVSFATAAYREAQRGLAESALAWGGIDEVVLWDEARWGAADLYRTHIDIATERRGAGYWFWKPYIIADLLRRVGDDDIVLYYDAGQRHRFRRSIAPLIAVVRSVEQGFVPGCFIPGWGRNALWTKRDCFVVMGCDHEKFWNAAQVQATYSIWRKTEGAFSFLRDWLRYATDRRCLSDDPNTCGLPNLPGFIDHRHDQSIATNLAIKDAILCFGDSQQVWCGDPYSSKDINLISEWLAGDEAAVPWRHLCPPWRQKTDVQAKTSMAMVPSLYLALSRRPPESRSRKSLIRKNPM